MKENEKTYSNNEEWYDEEIAGPLLEIANKCKEKNISFISSVEYLPGDRGETFFISDDACLEMIMLRILQKSGRNIDSFIINLEKYARKNGINTDSIYMNAFK